VADTSLTVIGAGVVGLAVAARLAPSHPDLLVLERRERPGTEQSSRNSEVIHAGLYYSPGSLKARLCVRGNRLLYELGERHGVPMRRIGKLIVAVSEDEVPALQALFDRGTANGVELRLLGRSECRALEPHVPAVAGLLSPTTGILSAHGLMDFFLHQARQAGATLLPRREVLGVRRGGREYELGVRDPDGTIETLTSERVVNAAGLAADEVAARAGIDVDAAGYRQHWWKGSYFSVTGAQARALQRLVYPVPDPVSLGVHAVLGLDGRLRFGPDAEYLPDRRLDWRVDPGKRAAFAAAVRRILPEIADADLEPDLSGIRAKLQAPGEGFRDFVIAEESARGLPGLVNLLGIDSPGLTASAAIAEEVERRLGGA
jgi:L-2-hydroxyglutarate oxidase LhgO